MTECSPPYNYLLEQLTGLTIGPIEGVPTEDLIEFENPFRRYCDVDVPRIVSYW